MLGPLYIGWKYVLHHRWKSVILVSAITLILFLPPALMLLVERGSENLTSRAEVTPLLLGTSGSPLELTLNSLYFNEATPGRLSFMSLDAIDPGLAGVIPLYVRYRAREFPIVGTTSNYFGYRELPLAVGRPFVLLGECVLGSSVARVLDIGIGDTIISTPESLFDLAGVYPLKMSVVGVLSPTLSPDDNAVFTDLKTTWVIEGLGHGHQQLDEESSPDLVLSRDESSVTANAAVVQFNEITEENRNSFHFHGDNGSYPISGAIVLPQDDKAGAILLGRFLDASDLQLIRPRAVIEELLATVFTVQAFVLLIFSLVGVATLITAVLVFILSIRLRAREFLTLQRMGAARSSVFVMMGSETVFVLLISVLITVVLLGLSQLIETTELVLWLSE
jgi:putative ABC transport system permease protein